jgi:hypothetical protein
MSIDVLNALKLSTNRPPPNAHKNWTNPISADPDKYATQGRRVNAFLMDHPGKWFTFKEIAEGIGMSVRSVQPTSPYLWRLCKLGKLERMDSPNPRGGLPITKYRVPREAR